MKRLLRRLIDPLIDQMANTVARKTVNHLYYREMHPATLLFRESQEEAVAYIKERMPDALYFLDREPLLRYAVQQISIAGLVLELGVFKGQSIHTIARGTDRPVHGFDSFEGLPEDWAGNKSPKGEFSLKGQLPSVPASVTLHKGWFEDTLPGFLDAHSDEIALAHVDCDLYSSSKFVLDQMAERLRVGTILVFDDYFNYPGWREHEFKAFAELVARTGIEYKYLGYARHQVATILTRVP